MLAMLEEKNALRAKLQEDLTAVVGGSLDDVAFEHLLNFVYDLLRPRYSEMSVDFAALPVRVRRDVEESLDGDLSAAKYDTPNEIFERWMEWNGLINWSGTIRDALDGIRAAGRPRRS